MKRLLFKRTGKWKDYHGVARYEVAVSIDNTNIGFIWMYETDILLVKQAAYVQFLEQWEAAKL